MVFSRDFRRPKGAKSKHIFGMWLWCGVSCVPFAVVFHRVHWCRCAGFLSVLYWLVSSGGALPAFCSLYCFVLVVSLANMALFRVLRGFLEGFGVRMYVCMG